MTSAYAFVMAGGSGERFWPMSRQRLPKHLLRLLSETTLLEATLERLSGLIPPERTFVLTNTQQLAATRAVLPHLPPENIVVEPAKRDTGPACALATALAMADDPEAICLVLPADAMIHDVERFRAQLGDAITRAGAGNSLITLGIPPTFAATGFGYLETSDSLAVAPQGSKVKKLMRFVEKPSAERAAEFLTSERFYWNSGIFVWRASTFLAEAERQQPLLAGFIESLATSSNRLAFIEEHFGDLPKISVDYAIMENAKSLETIITDFDWDDVGSWTALPSHMQSDLDGNCFRGSILQHDASGNVAISNGRTIALCGVRDLVVVETEDAILVCHKDAVQKVKHLQEQMPEALK